MKQHLILHVIAKIMIPFIMVFALYVQFHGDYGPGGGFQAGVIFGAGFILYGIVLGKEATMKIVPPPLVYTTAALGVLLYTGVGVAGMFLGGEFLNYSVLSADSVTGQHLGILLIEFGVGMTVASVMIILFLSFADFRQPDSQNTD